MKIGKTINKIRENRNFRIVSIDTVSAIHNKNKQKYLGNNLKVLIGHWGKKLL